MWPFWKNAFVPYAVFVLSKYPLFYSKYPLLYFILVTIASGIGPMSYLILCRCKTITSHKDQSSESKESFLGQARVILLCRSILSFSLACHDDNVRACFFLPRGFLLTKSSPSDKQERCTILLDIRLKKKYIALCNMDKGDDPYQILGVAVDTSASEIKKAYRKLALKYHPDKSQDPAHNALFIKVSNAYEILSDEEAKESYNLRQRCGAKGFDPNSLYESAPGSSGTVSTPTSTTTSRPSSSTKQRQTVPKTKTTKTTKKTSKSIPPTSPTTTGDSDSDNDTPWNYTFNVNGGGQFHDPMELFRRVFEKEFGEDPNFADNCSVSNDYGSTKTLNVKVKSPKKSSKDLIPAERKKRIKDRSSKKPVPLSMATSSRTVDYSDGREETTTTTTVKLDDGTEEVVTETTTKHADGRVETKKNNSQKGAPPAPITTASNTRTVNHSGGRVETITDTTLQHPDGRVEIVTEITMKNDDGRMETKRSSSSSMPSSPKMDKSIKKDKSKPSSSSKKTLKIRDGTSKLSTSSSKTKSIKRQ